MEFDFEQFASSMLKTMPDAVVYADAQGIIRWWNGGAERVFGFSAAQAVGQSLDLIIPENLRARHWEGYEKTMRTGESRYGTGDLLSVPATRQDGTRISVDFTITPFHDNQGHIVGIAAVMRDVTAKFQEMRALRKQIAEHLAASRKS